MSNILKEEAIDLVNVFAKNKGIVIYVTIFSLFVFLISLMIRPRDCSIAYLVCSLGSLVSLSLYEPRNEKDDKESNEELVCGLKKIFYVIIFTMVSIGFLCF
jgi:hypothetical protein